MSQSVSQSVCHSLTHSLTLIQECLQVPPRHELKHQDLLHHVALLRVLVAVSNEAHNVGVAQASSDFNLASRRGRRSEHQAEDLAIHVVCYTSVMW